MRWGFSSEIRVRLAMFDGILVFVFDSVAGLSLSRGLWTRGWVGVGFDMAAFWGGRML